MWMRENNRICENAGKDMVVLIENWKSKQKRYRRYRLCLLALLAACLFVLSYCVYYQVDSSIPSVIHVRAGQEDSLTLDIPAKAELVSVGNQGKSNIPRDAITIDLSQPVTMNIDDGSNYQMNVKLFGFLPVKQVDIQVMEDTELIPVGLPVGIYLEAEGIMVIGVGEFRGQDGVEYAPSKYILQSGDYIRKLNGEEMTDKDVFIERIMNSCGEEQVLTVERGGELMELKVCPVRDENGDYRIGAWVRDNAQGVGTMTYIDSQGNFGALGHGINDVDTSTLMELDDGTIYQTEIISIHKGAVGRPGEMVGMIIYSDDRIWGDIDENCERGIFGKCNDVGKNVVEGESIPIGLKQEIVKGPAQILCTVDGTRKYYDIEITGIRMDNDNINRGIELVVTDPELLEITGGIVQGMSGAPIIQNGKFIGAVTHVLVQDATKGYGIFIETMLEH